MTELPSNYKRHGEQSLEMTMTFARPERGTDSITKTVAIAGDGSRAMKRHMWKDKSGAEKQGHTLPCKSWTLTERHFTDFHGFADLIEQASDATNDPVCIVRGRLPVGATRKGDTQRLAVHLPRWSNVVAFDLDDVPVKPGMEQADVGAIGAVLRAAMPGEWRRAGCVVQLTAGHGVKPGWRVRLWFATRLPVSADDLAVLFGPGAPAIKLPWSDRPSPFDTSVWTANQCNYIANPAVVDGAGQRIADFIERRICVLPGEAADDGFVYVPGASGIAALREALDMPAKVEREWAVGSIPPEMIDGPGVMGVCGRTLERAPPLLDAGSRRKETAKLMFRMMHAGRSADGALADVLDWACQERTDRTTGEIFPNVSFDGDCTPESLEAYLTEALENGTWFDGLIGRDYQLGWEPASGFGAVVDPDEADERGTGPAWLHPTTGQKLNPKYRPIPASQDAPTSPPYYFEGLMPQGCKGCILGLPGKGKSFVAVAMAGALADGSDFLGFRNLAQGRVGVLILAAEAPNSILRRIDARKKAGLLQADAALVTLPLSASPEIEAAVYAADADLRERHGLPLRVAIIDTLAQMFQMKEENNADMTACIALLDKLGAALGIDFVIVHHPAKSGRSPRGGGALWGALDWIWFIEGGERDASGKTGPRILSVGKLKDDEAPPSLAFEIQTETIGSTLAGNAIKAGYAVPVDARQTFGGLPKWHREVIGAVAASKGPVSRTAVRDQVAIAGGVSPSTLNKAIAALLKQGKLRAEPGDVLALPMIRSTDGEDFGAVED